MIRDQVQRVRSFFKERRTRKIARFVTVSVISTVVSFAVIALVYGFKIIQNEVDATLFGNLVGAYPSYSLNRRWTWGKTGRNHLTKEVLPFWTLALAGITFSILGATYAKHLVHTHSWNHILDTSVVDVANIMSAGVFWVLKFFIFNKIFGISENEEIEEKISQDEVPREL
jgi:putative flippase GtrA